MTVRLRILKKQIYMTPQTPADIWEWIGHIRIFLKKGKVLKSPNETNVPNFKQMERAQENNAWVRFSFMKVDYKLP